MFIEQIIAEIGRYLTMSQVYFIDMGKTGWVSENGEDIDWLL